MSTADAAPTAKMQRNDVLREYAFKPGQSGNPAGRQKGSRNRLGEAFIEALHDDFIAHGVAAIETTRTEKPDQYLKVIASLLPKDVNLNINDAEEMTDGELIDRIRSLTESITPLLAGIGDSEGGVVETTGKEQPSRVH